MHQPEPPDPDEPVMPLTVHTAAAKSVVGSRRLRWTSVALDAVSIATGWSIAFVLAGGSVEPAVAIAATIVSVLAHLVAFGAAELYLARVTALRLEEMTRVLRTVPAVALAMWFAGRTGALEVPGAVAAIASAVCVAVLFAQRSALRAWLLNERTAGRYCRPVVLVGVNDEGAAMYDLLSQHPELGFTVVGVYGDEDEARRLGLRGLWRGDVHAASWHVHAEGITGAIVSASTMSADDLNRVTRELLAVGAHVQLSSRLAGFASHRLRAQSIAYEPVIYLEQLQLKRWQTALKRTIDIVVGLVLLVPASVVIGVFALWVKLEDRGPAIFRQTRIGRDGRPFEVLKLRTMVVDAEARLAELRDESNERSGPLFKMEHDPRFTRVGRLMDATSINELPQLWNVLRGDMSIVGPRPSLPAEHAAFDAALQSRTVVRPGITGLWQVEARDNPSFDAYRRFDLHYVENWSVALDVVILAATAESVVSRLVRMAMRSPSALHGTETHNAPRAVPPEAREAVVGPIESGDAGRR